MTNIYEGKTVEWLLKARSELQDAIKIAAGSQTHAAIAPGMFHEFAELTQPELRVKLKEIRYALWCEDPDTYTNPETEKRMRVVTDYSGSIP